MWNQGLIFVVGPGVIVLLSSQLDGNYDVPQHTEITHMKKVQKEFCSSLEDAHYWAVCSEFPNISMAEFKKNKSQYVLVEQSVAHDNVSSLLPYVAY